MALTQVSSGMLGTTGVSAGTYGGSSAIPVLTVNAEGQVTSASNVSVSSTAVYANSGQLTANAATGTVALGLATTAVAAGSYGGATHSSITVDAYGRITAASNVANASMCCVCATGCIISPIGCATSCIVSPIVCATTCFVGSGAGITGINISGGGETITCAASSYTLTSADSRAIGLCLTTLPTVGCLILPDATTLTTGAPTYLVKNLNPNTVILVQDYCFCTLGYIPSCQVGQISLYNNSTAQGYWSVTCAGNPSSFALTTTITCCAPFASASCCTFIDANNKIHTLNWSCSQACVCTWTWAPTSNGYNITSTSFSTCSYFGNCLGLQCSPPLVYTTNDGFILIENRTPVGPNSNCCYGGNTIIWVVNCDSTAYVKLADNTTNNTSFCGVSVACFFNSASYPCCCYANCYSYGKNVLFTTALNNHLHFIDDACVGTAGSTCCRLQLDRTYYTVTGTTGTPTICNVLTCASFNPILPCYNPACNCLYYGYPSQCTFTWYSQPANEALLYTNLWNTCCPNQSCGYISCGGVLAACGVTHRLYCFCANGAVTITCTPCGSAQDNGTFAFYICSPSNASYTTIFGPQCLMRICSVPVLQIAGCLYGIATANTNGYYNHICLRSSGYGVGDAITCMNRVSNTANLFLITSWNCQCCVGTYTHWLEFCCNCSTSFNVLGTGTTFCQWQLACYNTPDFWQGVFGDQGINNKVGMFNYNTHYYDVDRCCSPLITPCNQVCKNGRGCFSPNFLLWCNSSTCLVWFGQAMYNTNPGCGNYPFAIWAYTPGTCPSAICAAMPCPCIGGSGYDRAWCIGTGATVALCGNVLCMGTYGIICAYNPQGSSFKLSLLSSGSCSTCVCTCYVINCCLSSCQLTNSNYQNMYNVSANTLLNITTGCYTTNYILSYNVASFPAVVNCVGITQSGYVNNCFNYDIPSCSYIGMTTTGSSTSLAYYGTYNSTTCVLNNSSITLPGCYSTLYANVTGNQLIYCCICLSPSPCYISSFAKVKLI